MRRRAPALAAAELPRMGVEAMWVYHPVITPRLVAATRAAGVELIAWTVDDLADDAAAGRDRGRRHLQQRPSAIRRARLSRRRRPPRQYLEWIAVESAAATASEDRMAPGTVMALVAMGLGVLVIANDFTALNVALPSIEHDLDTDVGTTQWVINAYALTFGMAIVTGGKLADMFGRRRVFFIGSVIFAVFSVAGGLAPNTGLLIAARVGHGDRRGADVAGDPRHDLRRPPGVEGGACRRADPRGGRGRQRDGAARSAAPSAISPAGGGSSSSTSRSRRWRCSSPT